MRTCLLIALILSLFCIGIVSAKPFVVCDQPGSDPSHYLLTLNTGADIETPFPLHYDLVDLAPGEYILTARAVYPLWGVTDPSVPLNFTKPTLTAPKLDLVAE